MAKPTKEPFRGITAPKTVRTIAGFVVLIAGIIMIPYPGPGWLVVFFALSILSRDHPWAARILLYARGKYDAWQAWLLRQPRMTQLAVASLTGIIVILTLWLLNVYGMFAWWLHLDWSWVRSPFFR